MAALLSGGDRALLDGEAAARLLRAWDRGGEIVEVTVPGRSHRRPAALGTHSFVFHRASGTWRPADPLAVGPIRTVGSVDICVRLASRLTPWQLAHVICRGRSLEILTIDALRHAVEVRAGARGNAVLRRAVELVVGGSVGTRSRTEDAVLADMLGAGVEEPLVNVRGAMELARDEPDLLWPQRGCNLEIDGGHHDDPVQAADDAARDRAARAAGWRVLRIRSRDYWHRRRATISAALRFLEDP